MLKNITQVYKDTVFEQLINLPDNRTNLQASISKINKTFTGMVTEAEYKLVNSKGENNVKRAQEEQNKRNTYNSYRERYLEKYYGLRQRF